MISVDVAQEQKQRREAGDDQHTADRHSMKGSRRSRIWPTHIFAAVQ
jgi:hypothetical protein